MCFHNFAVISDTHGVPATIQQALDEFKRYEVDLIVHCGDIVDPNVIKYFNDYKTEFVFGNGDFCRPALISAIESIGGNYHEVSGSVEWHGNRVFFTHGHVEKALKEAVSGDEWDLVCYGHLHKRKIRQYGDTLILNPGSLGEGSFCIVGDDLSVSFFGPDGAAGSFFPDEFYELDDIEKLFVRSNDF